MRWTVAIIVVVAGIYGLSEFSGVPYAEDDIAVVDFSTLTRSEKRSALQAANRERCTCACRMTLAQCVATDSTCPIRATNVDKIKAMVEQAKEARTRS